MATGGDMVDLFEKYLQGQQAGQAKRRQRTLSENYMGAVQGDRNALAQVYGVDPEAGMQAQTFGQQQQRAQRQEADDDIIRASKFYLQTKSPQAWSYIHQKFSADPRFQGMPAQITTPEDQEGSMQFANALVNSMGGGEAQNVQSKFIDAQGNVVALMRDGSTRTVGKADPSMQIIEGEGGFYGVNRRNLNAAPVQLGGAPQQPTLAPQRAISNVQYQTDDGQPIPQEEMAALQQAMMAEAAGQDVTIPVGGQPQFGGQLRPKQQQISPAESQRLAMERERLDMQRQEAEARRQANAVTGKAPTEGERAASGYLERMQAASKLLSGIEQQGYTPGSYRDYVAANNSGMSILGPLFNAMQTPQGQQYRQAQEDWVRAKLRKESGAVIGDEEMAREIRVYFPQPGDTPQVMQQKAAARLQAERQMTSMAGRAAVQPSAGSQAKPTPRRLKFNPQTGRIE